MLLSRLLCILVATISCVRTIAKAGKAGKARTVIYKGSAGSLMAQYFELKQIYLMARKYGRHVLVVQTKDETGSSHDMCSIFDLPEDISCSRKGKVKCKDVSATEYVEALQGTKRAVYHCDPASQLGAVADTVQAITQGYPLRLRKKYAEEVQYVLSMIGLDREKSPLQMAVVPWEWGKPPLGLDLGTCVVGEHGESACGAFMSAALALEASLHTVCEGLVGAGGASVRTGNGQGNLRNGSGTAGTAGTVGTAGTAGVVPCYLAGTSDASPSEVRLLSALGFRTFPDLWPPSLRGVAINPVSREVMEWGLMTESTYFYAQPVLTLASSNSTPLGLDALCPVAVARNSQVEFERMRHKRPYCAAHRAHLPMPDDAVSWCNTLKSAKYEFRGSGEAMEGWAVQAKPLNSVLYYLAKTFALTSLYMLDSRFLQMATIWVVVGVFLGLARMGYMHWRIGKNRVN